MDLLLLQTLNGVSYACVLYLVAVGLSLTYGVGRFLNLAHGAFYLLGAYLALLLVDRVSFWGALLAAPAAVALLALVLERLLLRRYAGEHHAVEQMLLTFGLAFVLGDLMTVLFGGRIRSLQAPDLLAGTIDLGVAAFPVYRLAVIGVGVAVALGLAAVLRGTRAGATIRAAAADAGIAATLGIDTRRVLAATYAAGAALAAFGGVIGAPVIATASGLDFATLILALVVVVIGGLGSVTATFWGALVVGLVDSVGRAVLPRYAVFILFLVLALVLVARPQGLFVRRPA